MYSGIAWLSLYFPSTSFNHSTTSKNDTCLTFFFFRKQKGLCRFVYENQWGGASVDYSDPEALEELTRSLLAEFYQIQHWNLPAGASADDDFVSFCWLLIRDGDMEMFASSFSTLGWLCLGQSPASSPAKMGMGESRKKPLGISRSVCW